MSGSKPWERQSILPTSTIMVCPVAKLDSSVARNSAAPSWRVVRGLNYRSYGVSGIEIPASLKLGQIIDLRRN